MVDDEEKINAARKLAKEHACVKEGERVIVFGDATTDKVFARAVASACRGLGAKVTRITLPSSALNVGYDVRERAVSEMGGVMGEALKGVDVAIGMASMVGEAAHSKALAELCNQKKIRVIGIWGGGRELDLVLKAMREHDYEDVYRLSREITNFLAKSKEIHITSKQGTDLTASIEGIWAVEGPYKWVGGIVREAGEVAQFPDGEAWGGPREGTANGVLVIDGAISREICNNPEGPDEPLKITVEEGKVVNVEGGKEAGEVRKLIDTYPGADNLSEIAIGTNRFAEFMGHCDAWDKKVAGGIHVAIGENTWQIYPYGTVDCAIHLDMVIRRSTVEVDGDLILRDGKLLL
ncbi:MAG: aminopeptidase [Halobacteriota archaeon]|nr:aminopeptidase [Halobacteriota archaeon]